MKSLAFAVLVVISVFLSGGALGLFASFFFLGCAAMAIACVAIPGACKNEQHKI